MRRRTSKDGRHRAPNTAALLVVATLLGIASPLFANTEVKAPTTPESALELGPVSEQLLGSWQRIDSGHPNHVAHVTSERWSEAHGGVFRFSEPLLGSAGDGRLVRVVWANPVHIEWRIEGDELVISYTREPNKYVTEPELQVERFRRLQDRPSELEVTTAHVPPPTGDLDEGERKSIRTELIRRRALDQEARSFLSTGRPLTPEDQAKMNQIDRDNTQYLLRLLSEVGWIDAERFGTEAAEGAFLIVQHSNHLPLMRGALPHLKREIRGDLEAARLYAMLFDRAQVFAGLKQRYGSQFGLNRESMFLQPLEDEGRVDQFRAEIGLEPLADKLEELRSQNDGHPIEIKTNW